MKDFHITATRNLDQAARRLASLERYAECRADMIDSLDLDALGPNQLFRMFDDDHTLAWALAEGHLYLHHLADMENLAIQPTEPMRLAA